MNLNITGLSDNQIKNALMEHLLELNGKLGITATLSKKGVTSDIIPILAGKAIKDPCNVTNPTPPVIDDLKVIYKESM